jgi:hypothetical protein
VQKGNLSTTNPVVDAKIFGFSAPFAVSFSIVTIIWFITTYVPKRYVLKIDETWTFWDAH